MSTKPNSIDGGEIDQMLKEATDYADSMAEQRTRRRERFEGVKPIPRRCIVAWVDILGFREQIRNAATPEEFQAIHRRMRSVHAEFEKGSASVEPDQEERNQESGKRIIALSDGLVIAQDLEDDRPLADVTSHFDEVFGFLEQLRCAQAYCAHAGNFIRGGVAIGYFWFDDDILLSPGLVSAYELETHKASNPVIVLDRSIAEELIAGKVDAGYDEDSPVLEDLFTECDWMTEGDKSKYLMLNFMPTFLEDRDPTPFLKRFVHRARSAREAAIDKAKPKYDWLLEHARQFVASELPALETEVFAKPVVTHPTE
jgi:hypothetical protein